MPSEAGCEGVRSVDGAAEAFPSLSEGRFRYCLQLPEPEEDASFLFGPWSMLVASAGAGACGLWSRAAHISSWGTLSTEVDGPEAPGAPPEGAIILASSGSLIVKTTAITSPPPHHPSLLKRKWRDLVRSMDLSLTRKRLKSIPINRNEKYNKKRIEIRTKKCLIFSRLSLVIAYYIYILWVQSPSVCRTLAHASNGLHLTVPSSVGTEAPPLIGGGAD